MTTLSVADFGPLGTADDSPTLNAALDAAYALADPLKTEVLVPAGLYWLRGPLLIGSYAHLIATGARFAWSAYSPTSMLRCRNAAPVFGYNGEHDWEVTGGIFDGNRSGIGDGTNIISIVHARDVVLRGVHVTGAFDHHLIEINGSERVTLEDCELSDSGSDSEALQLDGMYGTGMYSEFGAWDNTPCHDIVVRRCLIHGVRDGIGSHTVAPSHPHTVVTIEDTRIVCTGYGVKARNYRDVVLVNCDLDAPTPVLFSESGRVLVSGSFLVPGEPAAPLPDPLPPLPSPPGPDPDPDPLPPPVGGGHPMHVDLYGFDTGWTNMPAALTEPSVPRRVKVWAGPCTQMRVGVYLKTAGAPSAELTVEWSADQGVTWTSFDAWVGLATTGNAESAWVPVPEPARGDILLRYVGRNGNGTNDPAFGRIYATFR